MRALFLADIITGNELGKGKYGEVKTVTSFETKKKSSSGKSSSRQLFALKNFQIAPDERMNEANDMADENREKSVRVLCKMRLRNNKYRYAIKIVDDNLDDETKTSSILDLAQEAYFLQRITHPNIIRLRATVGEPGTLSFGLILDRLTSTLAEEITRWNKEYPECRGGRRIAVLNRLFVAKSRKKQLATFYSHRLVVALDLVRALRFLHVRDIAFRDMKTENIGFNLRGDLQLFDFGCAKELKEKDRVEPPDGYNASAMVGTVRYMAPEVMKGLPYGLSCDVYSFSLILWSLFSFEKPFATVSFASMKVLCHLISVDHIRPRHLPVLSNDLKRLMQDCWADNRNDRPSLEHVYNVLRAELDTVINPSLKRPFLDRTKHILDISVHSMSQYGD